jgi:hypothetical protein
MKTFFWWLKPVFVAVGVAFAVHGYSTENMLQFGSGVWLVAFEIGNALGYLNGQKNKEQGP